MVLVQGNRMNPRTKNNARKIPLNVRGVFAKSRRDGLGNTEASPRDAKNQINQPPEKDEQKDNTAKGRFVKGKAL